MSDIIWCEADLTQIRGLVRERNALARDNQALREAARALHSTVNAFFQNDGDQTAVMRAQSRLIDVLTLTPLSPSRTPERTVTP